MARGRRAASEEDGDVTPPTQRNRRRNDTPDEDDDVDMEEQDRGSGSLAHLAKGLVRYALSCEHVRKPIRRSDINEKVLGSHTRLFKDVFSRANNELMDVFGMQLVELPKPERVTMRQKRAAAGSESQSKSTGMWVLQTILPSKYRIPEILGPSRPLPKEDDINREDSYIGLYTMVIALITICGSKIKEETLDRHLRRLNANNSTPLGTTDKTIRLMADNGYIARVKETQTDGAETLEYIVGPRGKLEVGRDGVAELIRMMYGEEGDLAEIERKIERTLNIADAFNGGGAAAEPVAAPSQTAGKKRGRRRYEDDD